MLSFELSVIDLVLGIAVMILLILYAKELSGRYTKKVPTYAPILPPKKEEPRESALPAPASSSVPVPASSSGCHHFFGYLRDLAHGTPVPDECLGCSEIVKCLGPKTQSQQGLLRAKQSNRP